MFLTLKHVPWIWNILYVFPWIFLKWKHSGRNTPVSSTHSGCCVWVVSERKSYEDQVNNLSVFHWEEIVKILLRERNCSGTRGFEEWVKGGWEEMRTVGEDFSYSSKASNRIESGEKRMTATKEVILVGGFLLEMPCCIKQQAEKASVRTVVSMA